MIYLKILFKKDFISFQEARSAGSLYAIGILNFLPISVASGFEKACVALGYSLNV